jgi:hypothetical protein
LSQKLKCFPWTEFLPKTDRDGVSFAYSRWVIKPATSLGNAIRRGEPRHVLQGFIQVLRPGYKVFGGSQTASALFKDFRKADSWTHDDVIDQIGRRAVALEQTATTADLYITARAMKQVFFAYHLAKVLRSAPDSELNLAMPKAIAELEANELNPTAEDRQWAHNYLRSKHPSAAKAAPTGAQPIAGETRQMARWLLEALAKDDIETATLALKAFVTLGWPGDLLKAEFRTMLDEMEDFPDCGKQIARLYRIAEQKGKDPIQHAADAERAALFLVEAYKANTRRDPLTSHSRIDQADLDSYGRILTDKRRETFAEIHRYLDTKESRQMDELIEQLRPSQMFEQIDEILNDSEGDEVNDSRVAVVTDLPQVQVQTGIYWNDRRDLLGSMKFGE